MKIAAPINLDADRTGQVTNEFGLAALEALCSNPGVKSVVPAALSLSPHLARLARMRPETLATIYREGCDAAFRSAMHLAKQASFAVDMAALQKDLRLAKADLHLSVGIGDLAGIFDLKQTTAFLSIFADQTIVSALAAIARFEGIAESAVSIDPARGHVPGFFFIAMGKLGAFELNYSSDIDLVAFFDPAILRQVTAEPQKLATKLAQELVRALELRTEHGYVFRTDLRLRPDPGATPLAVSVDAAESYYESFGQNWERAAFIKSRHCAGDSLAAAEFQHTIDAFVWRKNLDFAAIADIHSIKRQINAHKKLGQLDDVDPDLKLGRGGIREIEFFAQTQQLIMGGRVPSLRPRRTDEALIALEHRGALEATDRVSLQASYDVLRTIEHRIQMVDDEQTHRVPKATTEREILANFCGYTDRLAFEVDLREVRMSVAARYDALFAQEAPLSDIEGSLVFTGVDDDPDTLQTLKSMGFSDPSRVAAIIRDWHRGHVRAMRSARAREILTRLMPVLLRAMAQTGDADAAFGGFNGFLAALPAGVQALALFEAQPDLLRGLIAALALSPLLAETLGRRPAILDTMFDPNFSVPIGQESLEQRRARLDEMSAPAQSFEAALNVVRRWRREEAFRIGLQTLTGTATAKDSGAAYADIADCCVQMVADAALKEVSRRFGPPPGRWGVFGLGKFGGRELAEGSDLDIIVIYDADEAGSSASNDIAPSDYFARFTQRLIAGLSAPTEEGGLYDVDMNLRPSGRAGPVAVNLSAFKSYYEKSAWTWELMALTRLRFAVGDAHLAQSVQEIARAVLSAKRDNEKLSHDAADMRARIAREKGDSDPWDLKLAAGGIVDIEFLAQYLTLKMGGQAGEVAHPNTSAALDALRRTGALSVADSDTLQRSLDLLLSLSQVSRLAFRGKFSPDRASTGLKQLLARSGDCPSFEALEAKVLEARKDVRRLLMHSLAPFATEAGLVAV